MNKNLLKSYKTASIVSFVLLFLAGICTVIFAILSISNVQGFDASLVLRIIVGISLLFAGLIGILVGLIKGRESIDTTLVLSGAASFGLGVFFFLEISAAFVGIFGARVLPIVLACVGFGLAVKGLISLFQKDIKKVGICYLITGLLFGVLGTVLACIDMKTSSDVFWIILGVLLAIGSIVAIVRVAKLKPQE